MSDKPKIRSKSIEGRSTFDGDTLAGAKQVPTHQLNVNVKVPLLERLRAASTWEDRTIVEIVDEALTEKLNRMETDRGKPYDILPGHSVRKR